MSLWLNATGAPGQIAGRAGNCVRVLQDFYTHCIDQREDAIGQQIEEARPGLQHPAISSVC